MNYKDKENVILAKWEYDDNSVGYKLRTESGRRAVPLDTPLNERVKAKKLHCNKEKMKHRK